MAFVVTAGQLASVSRPVLPAPMFTGIRLSDDLYADYATIWRHQPQVRTVVGFLARNIAQLGLHVFRRVSDLDRERLSDHPVSRLFAQPNPTMTLYRLMNTLVSDIAIYENAYWVKVRADDGSGLLGLVPVPPSRVTPLGSNWIAPDEYEIRRDVGKSIKLPADQVVHFRGYNPDNPWIGDSPMNALRALLLEEYEATRQRQAMWRNGARMSGVITRPMDAPQWSDPARERFRSQWRASYTGSGGDTGGTPLLEDGMTWTSVAMDSQQAQYVESRRLTREEVCCAYWIPPPMVGILEHATFGNITEQHKMLYQDCLGPWLTNISQEIALQVLPDIPDTADVYVEFNIAEKMRGSFEEQAAAASTSTGRPWMTVNEQRARFNLPQHADGDGLVVPLNVLVGGMASPKDTAPDKAIPVVGQRVKAALPAADEVAPAATEHARFETELARYLGEQGAAVLGRVDLKADPSVADVWGDEAAHNSALAEFIVRFAARLAQAGAAEVLETYNPEHVGWSSDDMLPWLAKAAESYAFVINTGTLFRLENALAESSTWNDDAAAILGDRAGSARVWALRVATECLSFGGQNAAKASGLTTKTWRAGDQRHAHLDGVHVGLTERFANQCRWPGDSRVSADETADCACRLTFS